MRRGYTMNIDYIWNRGEEKDWLQLLKCYKQSLKRCSLELDDNLDIILDISVRKMDGREFYSFIYNDYFGGSILIVDGEKALEQNLRRFMRTLKAKEH